MRQSLLQSSPVIQFTVVVAWLLRVPLAEQTQEGNGNPDADADSCGWRIVNAEPVEIAWRVRAIQFFSNDECTSPIAAEPNRSGVPFATTATEMTGAAYAFALHSPRGWESEEACPPGECHLGFTWNRDDVEVRCLLVQQGEPDFHAPAITLQHSCVQGSREWVNATTWRPLEPGKLKLAMSCPGVPAIRNGKASDCKYSDERSGECTVQCSEGYGTVEPSMHCSHGAWYMPECLAIGSLIRLVARAPELIKPYWVVLDAALYASPDCTDVLRMDGVAVSSGEYVIKYANYHPKNAWDSDASTSWASSAPCTPGSCYFGFRFRQLPAMPLRCVRIEHPHGKQYQATQVSVEVLGRSGWEELPDVSLQLLPEADNQEL